MKVDKHISELLYEHDCVIVPDLGGFVANYAPAKVHPTQHTFIPPSKNISFNTHLKNNDGLLANHIAVSEKTSYPEAIKYIRNYSTVTQAQLKKGEKVTVANVGTLLLDVERNIQFEPAATNFLTDAFGLAQFQSPAVKRDTISKRIEKEFIDRSPVPATPQKKKRRVAAYIAVAVALPMLVGSAWLFYKMDVFKNINYSSLNPFATKVMTKAADKSSAVEPNTLKTVSKNIAAPTVSSVKDTVKVVQPTTATTPVTAALVDTKKEVGLVKADTTRVAVKQPINTDFKFHLIAGCFQVPENADRFVTTLRNQNLSASIIGKRNGLLVVSAGDYATREEAYTQLRELKKSQPEAWLLVK